MIKYTIFDNVLNEYLSHVHDNNSFFRGDLIECGDKDIVTNVYVVNTYAEAQELLKLIEDEYNCKTFEIVELRSFERTAWWIN